MMKFWPIITLDYKKPLREIEKKSKIKPKIPVKLDSSKIFL